MTAVDGTAAVFIPMRRRKEVIAFPRHRRGRKEMDMQITQQLRNAAAEAVSFSAKARGPALTRGAMLLRAGGGKLTVSSCGAHGSSCSRTLEAPGLSGEAAVNGAALLRFLDTAEPGDVFAMTAAGVSVSGPRGEAELYTLDGTVREALAAAAREFPAGGPSALVPLSVLRSGLREVAWAMSERQTTGGYALGGVTLCWNGGKLSLYAVDSTRAALFTAPCPGTAGSRCVIPADIAAFIQSGKWPDTAPDEVCRIRTDGSLFFLKAGDVSLSSPTVSGSVFDIRSVTEAPGERASLRFNSGAALRTVNRVIPVLPSGSGPGTALEMELDAGSVCLSFCGPLGRVSGRVAAESPSGWAPGTGKLRLGVSARSLRESLAALDGAEAELAAGRGPGIRPVLIKAAGPQEGTERTHILLPAVLKNSSRE